MIELDFIQKCVINLPHRTDRLERTKNEIKKFFNNHDFTIIEGVEESPVHRGIAQAHINAVRSAYDHNYVLIMEDDIHFYSDFCRQYADECLRNLPHDWEVLLGSVYNSKGISTYNEYWSRLKEFCGLTFYIVRWEGYERILNFDRHKHIDRAFNDLKLNCYVSNKFFALQYSGYSDNTKSKQDYSNLIPPSRLLSSP